MPGQKFVTVLNFCYGTHGRMALPCFMVQLPGYEPWFLANPVCDLLDLGGIDWALTSGPIVFESKDVVWPTRSDPRCYVTEAVVLRLAAKSRKLALAGQFLKWLVADVMPMFREFRVEVQVEARLQAADQLAAEQLQLTAALPALSSAGVRNFYFGGNQIDWITKDGEPWF